MHSVHFGRSDTSLMYITCCVTSFISFFCRQIFPLLYKILHLNKKINRDVLHILYISYLDSIEIGIFMCHKCVMNHIHTYASLQNRSRRHRRRDPPHGCASANWSRVEGARSVTVNEYWRGRWSCHVLSMSCSFSQPTVYLSLASFSRFLSLSQYIYLRSRV